MSESVSEEKPVSVIQLEGALDISQASHLREKLLAVLEQSAPFTLDASEIARADTAGLQVLLAFVVAARECGIPIEWQNPSEIFRNASQQLGLCELLGLPEAADVAASKAN